MQNTNTVMGYRLQEGETVLLKLTPKKSTAAYFLLSKIGAFLPLIVMLVFLHLMHAVSGGNDFIYKLLKNAVMQQSITTEIAIGLVVLLLIVGIYGWMQQVVKGYQYVITNQRIILKFGFISHNTRIVPYSQLADVNSQASFWERLCGIQSINIDTTVTAINRNRRRSAGSNTNRIEGLDESQVQQAVDIISAYLPKSK